jgi:hypothetical protein
VLLPHVPWQAGVRGGEVGALVVSGGGSASGTSASNGASSVVAVLVAVLVVVAVNQQKRISFRYNL